MSQFRNLLTGILIVLTGACAEESPQDAEATPCTKPWYTWVESRIATGDGQGHGPDPGSEEWRSVIEFKLGIRGDKNVPPRNSAAWCEFIDAQLSNAK